MEYGYARVSSKDQNLGRQIAAFKAQGIKAQNVYCDKKSGKDFDRIYYKRLVRRMKEGDVLFITELDRLGRNYTEILEQWQYLTKQKKINIVVLDMDLLDTRNTSDLVHRLHDMVGHGKVAKDIYISSPCNHGTWTDLHGHYPDRRQKREASYFQSGATVWIYNGRPC